MGNTCWRRHPPPETVPNCAASYAINLVRASDQVIFRPGAFKQQLFNKDQQILNDLHNILLNVDPCTLNFFKYVYNYMWVGFIIMFILVIILASSGLGDLAIIPFILIFVFVCVLFCYGNSLANKFKHQALNQFVNYALT